MLRVVFRVDELSWMAPDGLGAEYPNCRGQRFLSWNKMMYKMMFRNVKLLKDTKSTVTTPSYGDSSELMSCIVDLLLLQHPIKCG